VLIRFVDPIENKRFFIQLYNAAGNVSTESEDCLFLNVFTPNATATEVDELKPVMFWIHGGSLEFGSASSPEYDGSRIAANQDVIVVTTNYRLNIFGFPISPEIPVSERNIGMLDQRMVSCVLR
jgi:carboxylesterase type B